MMILTDRYHPGMVDKSNGSPVDGNNPRLVGELDLLWGKRLLFPDMLGNKYQKR